MDGEWTRPEGFGMNFRYNKVLDAQYAGRASVLWWAEQRSIQDHLRKHSQAYFTKVAT